MPFDGKNVDMHEAVFFPTASRFKTGEDITYSFDKYIWKDGVCKFDYYYENIDLAGTKFEVSTSSSRKSGSVCAVNLYLKGKKCGRRCKDKDMTAYMFIGKRVIPEAWYKKLARNSDGFIGAAIVGYAAYEYDTLNTDQYLTIGGFVHYGLEILADASGNGFLAFLSNIASMAIYAVGFPVWCYYAYGMYDFYKTSSDAGAAAWPLTSADWNGWTNLPRFMMATAVVLEQWMDPMEYTMKNFPIVAGGIGALIFT